MLSKVRTQTGWTDTQVRVKSPNALIQAALASGNKAGIFAGQGPLKPDAVEGQSPQAVFGEAAVQTVD